ncbi:MAG: hypothetical protein HY735_14195 [Verrucomicrobia bacterium]|nr:hypothetical protein [Verrucomicrobiota bacterium]
MALIRVTRSYDKANPAREEDLILNTAHISHIYPDFQSPARGVFVQMVNGEPLLIKMTFEEIWTLIQRET